MNQWLQAIWACLVIGGLLAAVVVAYLMTTKTRWAAFYVEQCEPRRCRFLRWWLRLAAVMFLGGVAAVYARYDANLLTDAAFDVAYPPDRGEDRAYGAAAIREHKRVFRNWVDVDHYRGGSHKTNFARAHFFGTNSVPGTALTSNSIPTWAYQTNSVPSHALQPTASFSLVTNIESSLTVTSSTALVSLFTSSAPLTVASNGYNKLMLTADVMFGASGNNRTFTSNSFRTVTGTTTNWAKVYPDLEVQQNRNVQVAFSTIINGGNTNAMTVDFFTKGDNANNAPAQLLSYRVWGF